MPPPGGQLTPEEVRALSLAAELRTHLSRVTSADRKQWRTFERSDRATSPYASEQAKRNARGRADELRKEDKRRTRSTARHHFENTVVIDTGWHHCLDCGCLVFRCEHDFAREKRKPSLILGPDGLAVTVERC